MKKDRSTKKKNKKPLKSIQREEEIREAMKKYEEKYRFLFENIPIAVGVATLKGQVLDANRGMEKITGYTLKELKKINLSDTYVNLRDRRGLLKQLQKNNQVRDFEAKLKRKNGTIYYALLDVYKMGFNGEELLLTTTKDITKQKEIEESLQRSEENLKGVIQSSPNAITVTNLKGKIIDCSQATLNMHGFSTRKELIGKNSLSLIAPQDHQRAIKNTKKVFKKGVIKNIEYTFLTKNGREFPAELSASLVRDSSGKPVFFMAITQDISERKRVEEARQKFIEIATHQLRSPLVACRWTLTLLKRRFMTSLGLEASEYLEQMGEHIEKLLSLAKDLLNTSKIESGDLKLNTKKTYLQEFLRSVIHTNQALLNRKRIEAREDFKKKPKIPIETDLEKLDDIIDNLINNAIKYSSNDSEIHMGFRKQKDYVIIYIKDKGVGIPEKDKDKIFKRFFRASNVINGGIKGNGLGLFIAKEYARLLGGKLYFESKQNKGSAFFLKIPIKLKNP